MATAQHWTPDLRAEPAPSLGTAGCPRSAPIASEPPAPPPPAPRYSDPATEVLPWTGLSLLVALSGLFLLIAFPGRPGDPEEAGVAAAGALLDQGQELELVTALAQLRRALVAYRADQGRWPGVDGGSQPEPPPPSADPWQSWFDLHVVSGALRSSPGPLIVSALEPLSSYLPGGALPINAVNGLCSVLVLRAGERMPAAPDGRSGWILDPRSGDLRANSVGRLRGSGRALFDL